MARVTGRRSTTSPDGLAWESELDDEWAGREPGVVRSVAAETSVQRSERLPTPGALSSYDPIHQRAEKHSDRDDPVHGEERRIELRKIPGLHQLMLPGDQRRSDPYPDIERQVETGSDAEAYQGENGDPVQSL